MSLDEVLQTLVVESRDLLQSMEDALLRIEQSPDDEELINAIFRAAHTIKGSAGLFGLNHIVAFTHTAESVLDRVRKKLLRMDADLVVVMLSSCDHITSMIEYLTTGDINPTEEMQARSADLIAHLNTYMEPSTAPATPPATGVTVAAKEEPKCISEGGGEVETDLWHISLRFGPDVLRNGMDPLSILRYLTTIGDIHHIWTELNTLPPTPEMNPESCYLGFEISLKSAADKATIETAFEFIRDDCQIFILPPHSKITDYVHLIEDLPEENMRIGEMLVRAGTLTQTELDQALKLQRGDGTTPQKPIGEVLLESHMVPKPVLDAALDKQKQIKEHKNLEASLIRVDAEKLDQLINLVGELIITGAGTNLIAQRIGVADLLESTAALGRIVEEIRDSALRLRMVQIGGTFNRFQRVVRDVSRELNKDIELVIAGAETELDKTVVEKIADPLTHLVRNSMDHGIEPADIRLANGKPAKGTLKLNAFHDAGSIVIEVSDDGGGLNKQRILKKAIERGLISESDAHLSDSDIYNLIFEPGFSTAEAVSNLSGRGVGMDVVLRNITALRGTINLDSEEGKGTTTSIRLPLTLAIIDGFLVSVGAAVYVIPLDIVDECIERNAWENAGGDSRYLNLRGEVLPYLHIREYFGIIDEPELERSFDEDEDDDTEENVTAAGNSNETAQPTHTEWQHKLSDGDDEYDEDELNLAQTQRENVVVVRCGNQKLGLVVDKLLGEFQTVIKPLGKVLNNVHGIGGCTILGNGKVALILDVPGLMNHAATERAVRHDEATRNSHLQHAL